MWLRSERKAPPLVAIRLVEIKKHKEVSLNYKELRGQDESGFVEPPERC
jgi:hypothetical protein